MEKLSHADYNIIFDNDIVEEIPIEILEIGSVNLPTGEIIVCDPLVNVDMPPLAQTVAPGKYPVKIYVAKSKEWGDRYAVAKLEFSKKKAVKWVLATREGEDVSELTEEGDFFGFPVDAGLGGFFDSKTRDEYVKFYDDFVEKNPNGNIYDDLFEDEFRKNAQEPDSVGDWINYTFPNTDLNITMFQSGFGDGVYPAYWGVSADGEIVSLVIDFFVLLLPDD